MIKTALFILLCISLASCKQTGEAPAETVNPTTPSTPGIDPATGDGSLSGDLQSLTNQFKLDYSATWSNITIGFKPASYMNSGNGGGTTVVGVCEVYSNGTKKVWMNESWWNAGSTSNLAKKILFYHEMGHCYFNRDHDVQTYAGGRPYSIMYPILDPVVLHYPNFSAYYLAELSNPSSGGTMTAFAATASVSSESEDSEEVTLVHSSKTDIDGNCVN